GIADARRRRRLQFAARQRPCIRAQAIEFASIAFRKRPCAVQRGLCPNVLPLRTGSAARRFWHKCAYSVPARQGEAKVSGCVGAKRGTDSDPTYRRQAASIREKVMKFHSLYRLDLG